MQYNYIVIEEQQTLCFLVFSHTMNMNKRIMNLYYPSEQEMEKVCLDRMIGIK
jgi:hypothetical protein